MSRRLGYGRAVSETAAEQITARLRLARCAHVTIDRGTGQDPQPEWRRLRIALRPTDTLVIATLPAEGKHRKQVMLDLENLASSGAWRVEILPGARLSPGPSAPDPTPNTAAPPLSAGQRHRYPRATTPPSQSSPSA